MKTCTPKSFLLTGRLLSTRRLVVLAPLFLVSLASAQSTNAIALPPSVSVPDVGASLIRVIGALILVLALFLGGVWMVRNWQRLTVQRGRAPKLKVLEVRSLGGRQAIHVVGYEQERFLISSSAAGINFLTHLPTADQSATDASEAQPVSTSFAQALTQVLKGK